MSETGTAPGEPAQSVFVTVGTDHHPFDRLIRWVDEWLNDASVACFVQFGTSQPSSLAEGSAYLSHEETHQRITDADAVVCHGGPGTIIDCLRSGTVPIVVPRRHGEGEHVDDHQVRFTARLEESSYIKVAHSSIELAQLIDASLRDPIDIASLTNPDMLQDSVAKFTALVQPLFPSADERR